MIKRERFEILDISACNWEDMNEKELEKGVIFQLQIWRTEPK